MLRGEVGSMEVLLRPKVPARHESTVRKIISVDKCLSEQDELTVLGSLFIQH